MMKHFGIHLRLLTAAFLLIGAATLTIGVVGVRMTSRFMQERFESRIAFLARYLAVKSEVGVLINDTTGLKSLAHNLLGEKDVARVQILDKEDAVLVDLSKITPGPLSQVETPVVFKRVEDESILFSERAMASPNPFVSTPPKVEDYIGKVRIYFSTRSIDQLIVIIANRFLWLSLGLAVIAGIVFYLASRPIAGELNQLADTARSIGGGDFDLRVSPGKLPETRALAHSFNAMLDSLKESQRSLDAANREMMRQKAMAEMGKFSMMVAHEVKNPLAIIKSSLDVMKKDVRESNARIMVGYIEDEILRLNRLIEDFLQFARPTKPTLREVDLNGMLQDLVGRFEMMTCDKGPRVTLQCEQTACEVEADRDLLMRAFSNIIKNACDAAGVDGRIHIEAGCESVDPDEVFWYVRIADSGEGIEAAVLDRIFEPFFTTRTKGTGLGLAFAKQVFNAHGGTVRAENGADGGAVFTVRIPTKHPSAATMATAGPVNRSDPAQPMPAAGDNASRKDTAGAAQ